MTLSAALNDLRALLGNRLSTVPAVLQHHAQSETHVQSALPDAVAFPENTAEVAEIAKISARHSVPLIGWGAGTSLEGHALPVRGGVTVDFERMAQVLAVQPEDMLVRVQPGITREALNTELARNGAVFPRGSRGECQHRRHGRHTGLGHHGGALWHDARRGFGA